MARFEATVRLLDLAASDAPTVRRTVEERLRTGGFTRWQIVHLGVQGAAVQVPPRRPMRADVSYAGGGLLVAAVVAWTLWFLWLLTG